MTKPQTEDAAKFGEGALIYCDQHLRPHMTGWCTVSIRNKVPLKAKTMEDAYTECKERGFLLEKDE